jgi:uncharacterized membrane protein
MTAGREARMRHTVPPIPSARTQVLIAAAFGIAVGVPVGLVAHPEYGTLIGWDAAAAFYLVGVWLRIGMLDGPTTAALAEREDPTRAAADLLLLTAAVASLVAVVLVLARAGQARSGADLRISLGLGSVVLSWLLVHTVFTLRYARLYHSGEDGGIDFNQAERPTYRDFAYLAFTVGMTFQVSDTAIERAEIRHAVLRHALLSFLFGTGILATTINLVAALSSR